jgi:hypothetical protein
LTLLLPLPVKSLSHPVMIWVEFPFCYLCLLTMRISIPLHVIDLHDDGFHLLAEVKIGKKPFWVVVDTGASKTVFDQLMLLQADDEIAVQATEKFSAGLGTTSMQSYTAVIPHLKIGKLKLPDFEVAVLDLSTINHAYAQLNHPQILGVLGGDILMRYQAVIHYGKQRLQFLNGE